MQHTTINLSDLGLAVAQMRREKGLTQKELGALAGMGQSTLARFETGQAAEFGSRKLLRLLDVLGSRLTLGPSLAVFTLDDALAQRQKETQARPTRPSS